MVFQITFHWNVKLKNGTIDRYVCARCKWELQKRAYISSFHEEIVHWTGYTMYVVCTYLSNGPKSGSAERLR